MKKLYIKQKLFSGIDKFTVKKEDDPLIHKLFKQTFAECRLELHPTKTRIVYCKDKDKMRDEDLTEFDFLGYTFKAVCIMCKEGKSIANFLRYS